MKNKYPKPHQTSNPTHNEDYVFVEKPGENFTGIKLISGPYASIVYKYGNVGFAPESEKVGDKLPMKFDYTVIENKIDAQTDIQEFIKHIGDVLVVLLDDHIKEKKELDDGKNWKNSA